MLLRIFRHVSHVQLVTAVLEWAILNQPLVASETFL